MTLDMVNSPKHYTEGGIETWEFVLAKLGPMGTVWYCMGNAIKYLSRAPYKGKFIEDVKKARWYLDRMIEILEREANV